jgi:hypothetical protein
MKTPPEVRVPGPGRPKGAGRTQILAEKKINVTATDAMSAGAGRYAAILWVSTKDVNKAAKALGAS